MCSSGGDIQNGKYNRIGWVSYFQFITWAKKSIRELCRICNATYVVATHLRYVTQTCDITRQLSNELIHYNWFKSFYKSHLESYFRDAAGNPFPEVPGHFSAPQSPGNRI